MLDPWVNEILDQLPPGALRDVMQNLLTRPTFEQQWPDQYQDGLIKGKARILKLESIRKCSIDMAGILASRPAILEWWNQIEDTNSTA